MKNYLVILIGIIILSFVVGIATYFIIEAVHGKKKYSSKPDCSKTRWGCCLDGFTPKYDSQGSNCLGS